MILHACDGCGIAIRAPSRFYETTCGDCARQGLPTVAHTVCERCSERGIDVVRLALQHQVSAHQLPEAVLEAKPIVLWPWKIRRGFGATPTQRFTHADFSLSASRNPT
jgi:hypothetical protein